MKYFKYLNYISSFIFVAVVAATISLPDKVYAGRLVEIYNQLQGSDEFTGAIEFRALHAERSIETRKRLYYPSVSLVAKELMVEQRISQDETGIFEEGRAGYNRATVEVEVDQPLYDSTISPQIDEAEAKYENQQQLMAHVAEQKTRLVVESFINATKYYALNDSYERVITRLEEELVKAEQRFDVMVATFSDVENVKFSLATIRHEQSINNQRLKYELLHLDQGEQAMEQRWVALSEDFNVSDLAGSLTSKLQNHEVNALKAEVVEVEKRMAAVDKKDWPRLSLVGRYIYDDSAGSVFGGARTFSGYEFGVKIKWDLYDRGVNRSESQSLNYLKMAKEVEVRNKVKQLERDKAVTQMNLEQSKSDINNLKIIVDHQDTIRAAVERSFTTGGTESFINVINSFLLHEFSLRKWESARHDGLFITVDHLGREYGWDDTFVQVVDKLFMDT